MPKHFCTLPVTASRLTIRLGAAAPARGVATRPTLLAVAFGPRAAASAPRPMVRCSRTRVAGGCSRPELVALAATPPTPLRRSRPKLRGSQATRIPCRPILKR